MRRMLVWTSVLETVSFLALLGAMLGGRDAAVSVTGMVHGLLFLLYAALVWSGRDALRWSTGTAALLILTGPVGAVLALDRLRRDQHDRAQPRPEDTMIS